MLTFSMPKIQFPHFTVAKLPWQGGGLTVDLLDGGWIGRRYVYLDSTDKIVAPTYIDRVVENGNTIIRLT